MGGCFSSSGKGAVKMWEPASRRTVTIGDFPAATAGDAGALGLTLARDFEKSGHLYTIRVPAQGAARLVLARFTLEGEKLTDEREMLTIPLGKGREQSHCGAGLAWDAQGNLIISVGDNMAPQDVPAIHAEDAGRDSRATAGNSKNCAGRFCALRRSRTAPIASRRQSFHERGAGASGGVCVRGAESVSRDLRCKDGLRHLGRRGRQCAHGTGPRARGFR
jgi:glucose/arabinose dehydrogenase